MPSRASVSPRETWPRGNQQQLARGRDAHTSPREAPAHSSSLQNTARRVGRKKTPKARKKKHQQNIKTWLSIPRARGTKQCPLQEGTGQSQIPGKFRSGHLHPSGTSARARPGAAPHAAPPAPGCGFLLLGEGTERGDLSLGAGAVINNRKRTCQEGQEGERDPERKEAVRKQSLPFFAARRPAPTRRWARGGAELALHGFIWPGIGSELFTKSSQILSQPVITAKRGESKPGAVKNILPAANVRCRNGRSESSRRCLLSRCPGPELGSSQSLVPWGEAEPRAGILQLPAAPAGQEAPLLHADVCTAHPSGLFLFSRSNLKARVCWIYLFIFN